MIHIKLGLPSPQEALYLMSLKWNTFNDSECARDTHLSWFHLMSHYFSSSEALVKQTHRLHVRNEEI